VSNGSEHGVLVPPWCRRRVIIIWDQSAGISLASLFSSLSRATTMKCGNSNSLRLKLDTSLNISLLVTCSLDDGLRSNSAESTRTIQWRIMDFVKEGGRVSKARGSRCRRLRGSVEGVSPSSHRRRGLGKVLCLSPDFVLNFGSKWAIFVRNFLCSGKGGGHHPLSVQ